MIPIQKNGLSTEEKNVAKILYQIIDHNKDVDVKAFLPHMIGGHIIGDIYNDTAHFNGNITDVKVALTKFLGPSTFFEAHEMPNGEIIGEKTALMM